MKFPRIPALLATCALALAACKRENTEIAQVADNPLLAHAPVDTPFLFANIEPTPPDVVDAYMARMAPVLEAVQTLMDDVEININDEGSDDLDEARLMSAILNEVDGKLNREGLESLGLSLESHKVFYGMGMFPVARVALKDADALRAAITRVEAASGMSFDSRQAGDAEYWKIGDRSGRIAVYIAVLDGHMALSLFPIAAEDQWLPAFLGQDMPQNSMADTGALAALNREKGYSGYGSGYVDLRAVASELLDENGRTAEWIRAMSDVEPDPLSPVCVDEIKSMVDKAPRITGGVTELTANTVGMSYTLELETGLAGKLAGLVAEIPLADNNPAKVFSASLGLNMGRLRDFMLERATAISEAPYQCDRLQAFNQQAQQALEQLNRPMPPFINNLKGFRVSLDEVDFEDPSPEKIRGLFSLEVEKPQMLIGMAQMFVPGLDGLELEAGNDPVEVPQELLSFASGDLKIYAVMDKDSLGFAMGGAGQDELSAFMDASPDNDGILFSVEYDMAAPMELQNRFQRMSADGAHPDQAHDLAEKIRESYMQWLGRSRTEVGFTEAGLEVNSRMTFK